MNRDQLNEFAALYAMDLLEGEELREFERELAKSPAARSAVELYSETAGLVAFTAEEAEPPSDLEDRIMDQIQEADTVIFSTENTEKAPGGAEDTVVSGRFSWIPWGIAAGLAVTSAVLWNQRVAISEEFQELQAKFFEQNESLETMRSDYSQQVAQLESEVEQLEQDGAIQNLRISVLKSKLESAPYAQAVAVWNAAQQSGRLTVSQLPAVGENQDYQLWIIDPAYETPVSAGVFNTNEDGELEFSFTGTEAISTINAFALSLETKGGNSSPKGPIVLVSN